MFDGINNRKTILIAEDSPTQAELLSYALKEAGYEVLVGKNGEKALEILKQQLPRLVISDIMMPEMNGYELCKIVKSTEAWKHIPVILLTTLSDTEDVILGLESRADYFISKTSDKTFLIRKISEILDIEAMERKDENRFEEKIYYKGILHKIISTPYKTLNLLLTIYEAMVDQNRELMEMQDQLKSEIVKRIRLEDELEVAKDIAEAASRAKSTFLASMSHEIRTPMNAILGFSQLMLRESKIPPIQKERLETIYRSGDYLLGLINDILDISKIEAGRIIINKTTFDLKALLMDIEAMFRVRSDAKNIRLIVEAQEEIEQYVIGDEGKLKQILINLISNAIKFTNKGWVAVRVKTGEISEGEISLSVEVEDTGPGIPSNEMDKLFRVFEQTSTGIKTGGTGLGLALSRQFAHLMGGEISVWSEVDRGSCFSLELQVKKGQLSEINITNCRKKVIGVEKHSHSKRILIVDDEKGNREFLKILLEGVGFEIDEANNGEQLIESFKIHKQELIIMDLRRDSMDGLNGRKDLDELGVMSVIKSLEGGPQVHIIIASDTTFNDDLHTLLAAGADMYIHKPYKVDEIFEAIAKCIQVQYIFEEETTAEEKEKDEVYEAAFKLLPNELIERLTQATVNAQLDRLLTLISEVEEYSPILAKWLKGLAYGFRYDALIEFFIKAVKI